MKRLVWLMVVALPIPAIAERRTGTQIIDEAIGALGGRARIEAISTLSMTGTGTNGLFGQNRSPDAALPTFEITSFSRTVDFVHGRARHEQSRTAQFPYVFAPTQRQILAVDDAVAFNVSADGRSTRQGSHVATDRRAEYVAHHPIGVIRMAMSPGASVGNYRKLANMEVVDITTAGGDHATLAVDARSHYPQLVRTMSDEVALGDVTVETTFADYRDVDGVSLPMRLTTKTDRYVTADLKVSGATMNGSTVDLSAPQSVTSSAGPPPYTPKVTTQEVSKGIWLLAGEGHHSILVELSDHTELIEVPLNETRAIAVIAKARDVVRDKPLRKVIVTHHHFDHTAGVRAAVAEGLTLVAHQSNRTMLEDLSRRPHTIVPDTLGRHPRPMKLETVGERTIVADPLTPMEIYHVRDDSHSDTSLMVYFPKAKILVQADLFSTHFLTQPSAPSLLDNITKRRLDVRTHVPLHGEIRSHEQFTKLAQVAAAH